MPIDMPAPAQWFLTTTRQLGPLWRALAPLEAASLGEGYRAARVDRPNYVFGIARAGTTITLEILGTHPDAATQTYRDMVFPYHPHWWRRFGPRAIGLAGDTPQERPHGDRIMVTAESVETVEEPLWDLFFPHLHDETRSNVLDAGTSNPAFERFYRRYLRILIASRGGTRFTTKNNYYVARTGYLLKVSPDARLFLVVRDPVTHIGSLMKMDHKLGHVTPTMVRVMHGLGHYEFSPGKRFVNVGDTAAIREIRARFAAGKSAQGWALYWASIYGYLADRLAQDDALCAATLLQRYEDLCADPGGQVDRLLAHAQYDPEPYVARRAHYLSALSAPTYYEPPFGAPEAADIRAITREAAARYGYPD
jgi:hypothetical protein